MGVTMAAKLLRLMVALELTPADVDRLLSENPIGG
jgi:hypothetical protein